MFEPSDSSGDFFKSPVCGSSELELSSRSSLLLSFGPEPVELPAPPFDPLPLSLVPWRPLALVLALTWSSRSLCLSGHLLLFQPAGAEEKSLLGSINGETGPAACARPRWCAASIPATRCETVCAEE